MFAKALSITLLSLLSIPMALAAPTPGVPDLTVTLTDVNGVETVYASETSPSAELPGTILLNREGTPGALYFSCTPLEKSTVLSNVNAAFFGGGDCRFFVSNGE